ncbi:YqzG/YhdC family protein [Mesobacillus maritimus]|uniref:YqzG/YhdC family protein n=1 Tax=Mesobacillus maritimus TaxID=1643336 RepID=UPI00203DE250|nr:YqzG/YhdC family protein [Mesobacillus maritimus]MCM3586737.1 YqzG/YhdC family protein [Mesobacillus maritimus]MCM3668508.1 YqzG/YhdC family protein [Mesobacillus maritimus]
MKVVKSIFILFLMEVLFLAAGIDAQVPPYAKWGQVAMKETKKKYPQADIVDYQHIGRETGTSTSIEKFKLWLKEDTKEFGVLIDITFDNKSEEIIKIDFSETTREKYNQS